jgi:hypothetical protein
VGRSCTPRNQGHEEWRRPEGRPCEHAV